MLKRLALASIVLYQKYLSPRKGYSCAYRTCTGGPSCSALGFRAIRRHGLWKGLGLLDARLDRCGDAHRHAPPGVRARSAERGSCDVPCDSACDIPDPGCSLCDPFYGCGRDDSRGCRKPGKPTEDRPPLKRRARKSSSDLKDIEYKPAEHEDRPPAVPRGDPPREVK